VGRALALGGLGCLRLLLADARYADGPLLAWLKYVHGLDVLVRLPADRLLYADLQGLARTPEVPWAEHRYVRTIQGHTQVRRVAVASAGDLTSWDSFVDAARGYGVPDAALWACLIRELAPTGQPLAEAGALVSTRPWADGRAALHAYRPRWHSVLVAILLKRPHSSCLTVATVAIVNPALGYPLFAPRDAFPTTPQGIC